MGDEEKSYWIAGLIQRHLEGGLDTEEKRVLDEWLAESEHHREMFDGFCREEYLKEQIKAHAIFKVERGYQRFLGGKKQIDRRRIMRRVVGVAAGFVAICCVAGGILWNRFQQTSGEETVGVVDEITPGRSCATLFLAGGQQIRLSDSLFEQVEQPSAEIRIEGKQVNYQLQDTATVLVWNRMSVPRGGEYKLLLADGTQVWLNSESELKYPVAFTGNRREVMLKGEAYFEVLPDANKPFVVHTNRMDVRVLGTSFNVKAYEEETVQATLVTGSIEAEASGRKQVIVPGEQISWQDGQLQTRQVNVQAYIAWKEQRFVFDDELLETVVLKLARWYDVEFFIRNASVREVRFTGNLPKYENLNLVLEKLELATRIHFVQKGRTIVVEED